MRLTRLGRFRKALFAKAIVVGSLLIGTGGIAHADPNCSDPSASPLRPGEFPMIIARLRADAPVRWAVDLRARAEADARIRQQLLQPGSLRPMFGNWSPDRQGRPAVDPDRFKPFRWVEITLPRGNRTPAELEQHFAGLGMFDFVDYWRSGCASAAVEFDQSNAINDPLFAFATSDPYRHQWALTSARFPGAFQFTEGRSLVAIADQGLKISDQEFAGNLRLHYTASVNEWRVSEFDRGVGFYPQPDLIGPSTASLFRSGPRVGHGLHVAGIVAARKNNIGVSGACPSCSLAVMRTFRTTEITAATGALTNIGASAINYSLNTISFLSTNAQIAASLDMFEFADAREVMIVGSMGNDMRDVQTIRPNPMPGALPFALGVGASDIRGWRWEELLIATSPVVGLQGRHPLTNYSDEGQFRVTERCGPFALPAAKAECGSNFGTFQQLTPFNEFKATFPAGRWGIDVVAPGAQVLSIIDRIYTDFACFAPGETVPPAEMQCSGRITPGSGAQPDRNEFSYAPQRNRVGNAGTQAFPGTPNGYTNVPNNFPLPEQYSSYGGMTGTSMAAPHVTALVGLIRSVSPLMGNPYVEDLIRNTASRSVMRMPAPPGRPAWTEQEVGAGLIDAEAAVKATLGRSAGVQLRNRLTPVISMISTDVAWANEGAGTAAWLYTTSPQVASAAFEARLYIADDPPQSKNERVSESFLEPLPRDENGWDFGTFVSVAYSAAGAYGSATNIGTSIGFGGSGTCGLLAKSPCLIATRFPQNFFPTASFMLYTTPFDTHTGTPNTLTPLYRMSMKCRKFRKHFYTTSLVEAASYEAGDVSCTAASGPQNGQGYYLDGIEGYLSATPRGGIYAPYETPLYRGYNPSTKAWALMTADEVSRPAYVGYTTAVQLLGYVLRFATYGAYVWPVDQDGDLLNDAIEATLLGTSVSTLDTDGDGSWDGEEYTLDRVPSDPRQ